MEGVAALALGFVLDQLLGDPPSWAHPVRWLGRLIHLLEIVLRQLFPERLGGMLLLVLIIAALASLAPALRAARVDPMQVLREE